MSAIFPVCEQVEPNDPNVIAFINKIKKGAKVFIPEKISNPMPLGNCYWNANVAAKLKNGKILTGWSITLWPGSHLTAMHHAVFLGQDGKPYDVTESLPREKTNTPDLFVVDNSITINLDKLPFITSKFHEISDNPLTKKYISAYLSLNKIEKMKSDALYNAGFRCEQQKAIAMGKKYQGNIISESELNTIKALEELLNKASLNLGRAMIDLKHYTASLS
ncbi:TPA: hypothetical protein ACT16L_000910 [Klebsiella michiganensis]|uniref:hypothetical protein n=1 Tax=Klebsiella michiganensis TaxID=1134687 RepID=UPI0031DAD74A